MKNFPEIDFIVRSEGEQTFLELANTLSGINSKPLEEIHGLIFRKNSRITATPDREFIKDIDNLPNPARHFTFQHVASSRGCPWNCTFCGSPVFWKRQVRFHSPDYFVDQLEMLHDRGVNHFYVSDDTFTVKEI